MEIRTEMDSLPTADGLMPAYVCRPAGAGSHAAVIVVMEAFGLNAHIKDVAERIAREGYVTIAPDLFYRFGSPIVPYEDVPRALGYIQKFDDAVPRCGATASGSRASASAAVSLSSRRAGTRQPSRSPCPSTAAASRPTRRPRRSIWRIASSARSSASSARRTR